FRGHRAARDCGGQHAARVRRFAGHGGYPAADDDLRRSDRVRGHQAAGSWHAPGVRGRHERAGLHARPALLRGAMASLGAGGLAPLAPPPGQGAGWAKLAAAVETQVPPAEIDTIYVFRPIKREGREWGTAVVT